jgi:hypothetical protein
MQVSRYTWFPEELVDEFYGICQWWGSTRRDVLGFTYSAFWLLFLHVHLRCVYACAICVCGHTHTCLKYAHTLRYAKTRTHIPIRKCIDPVISLCLSFSHVFWTLHTDRQTPGHFATFLHLRLYYTHTHTHTHAHTHTHTHTQTHTDRHTHTRTRTHTQTHTHTHTHTHTYMLYHLTHDLIFLCHAVSSYTANLARYACL